MERKTAKEAGRETTFLIELSEIRRKRRRPAGPEEALGCVVFIIIGIIFIAISGSTPGLAVVGVIIVLCIVGWVLAANHKL